MTLKELLGFLRKHCEEHIKTGPSATLSDMDSSRAYEDILGFIDSHLREYARQKSLRKHSTGAEIEAILNEERKRFDNPVELIAHLQKIANAAPFHDDPRISLLVIQSFCNDFMNRYTVEQHQEQVKQAPF